MTDNVAIKDGSGVAFTMAMKDRGDGVKVSQSIATDSTGAVLIAQKTSGNSLPVVPASDYYGAPNYVGSATLSSAGQSATIATGPSASLTVQVSGAWTGSLVFERSPDTGVTWYMALPYPLAGGDAVASTTANGAWTFDGGGGTNIRVRAVTLTGGPITVNFVGTAAAADLGLRVNATATPGGIPSTYRLLSSAATTNAAPIKASAGRVYAIQGYNAASSTRFLKLYDTATAPVVGTDVPRKTVAIPALSAFALDWPLGLGVTSGLGVAITGAAPDADTTAIAAADIICLNIDYA